MKKQIRISLTMLFLICFTVHPLSADKSSVSIDTPDKAVKGSLIKIKLTVTHKGNNFFHYTNRVYLKINGKDIQRWEYSSGNRPESETFTREIDYTVEGSGPVNIEAEANCNLHGSTGKAEKKIEIE